VPFKSRKQQRWAYATDQPFAKEWSDETNFDSLPESKMPRLIEVYIFKEVEVHPQQAHLIDQEEEDPFGTGQRKVPMGFARNSMKIGR